MASKAEKNQEVREWSRRYMRVIQPVNGDVLLVQKADGNLEIFNGLRKALGASGRKNCIIVYVDNHSDVETLNEAEMKTYGWIRDPEWKPENA